MPLNVLHGVGFMPLQTTIITIEKSRIGNWVISTLRDFDPEFRHSASVFEHRLFGKALKSENCMFTAICANADPTTGPRSAGAFCV
jgi:hypothetical protein